MGKEAANASIVLLLGTSTAGKSTICEAVKAENDKLPEDKKLKDWVVDGGDILQYEIVEVISQEGYLALKDNAHFRKIQELQPRFLEVKVSRGKSPKAEQLYRAIFEGALQFDGQSLNLDDPEKFSQQLEGFIEKTGDLYGKEMLLELQALAQEKKPQIQEAVKLAQKKVFNGRKFNEVLFDRAIENSANGRPVILDMVPNEGEDIAKEFSDYLEKKGYQCPTHVALAHLPVRALESRMEARNAAAIASGNEQNKRDGLFPFVQYSTLFAPQKEGDNKRVVASLSKQDIESAIEKFGNGNEKRAQKLMEAFGFAQNGAEPLPASVETSVVVVAISPFDRLYSTESKESTAEIAKKICALATDKSLTPVEPAPFVAEMKSSSELFQKQLDNVDSNKPNSSIQALEAKVLDKQREALRQDGSSK